MRTGFQLPVTLVIAFSTVWYKTNGVEEEFAPVVIRFKLIAQENGVNVKWSENTLSKEDPLRQILEQAVLDKVSRALEAEFPGSTVITPLSVSFVSGTPISATAKVTFPNAGSLAFMNTSKADMFITVQLGEMRQRNVRRDGNVGLPYCGNVAVTRFPNNTNLLTFEVDVQSNGKRSQWSDLFNQTLVDDVKNSVCPELVSWIVRIGQAEKDQVSCDLLPPTNRVTVFQLQGMYNIPAEFLYEFDQPRLRNTLCRVQSQMRKLRTGYSGNIYWIETMLLTDLTKIKAPQNATQECTDPTEEPLVGVEIQTARNITEESIAGVEIQTARNITEESLAGVEIQTVTCVNEAMIEPT